VIVDLYDLEDGAEIATDLCVVGSGPAGIAVARTFLDGPLEVVMLESGGLEPKLDSGELNRGEVRGESYVDLRKPRLRALGGWIVAGTEARLAALVALDPPRGR